MKASLRALLTGVIDYAGLFPPAKLPLDEAIRNYARYRTEPESWMLGRFICPAVRLAELRALVEKASLRDVFLPLAILGQGGRNAKDFLDGLKRDFQEMAANRTFKADVYETRLPEGMTDVMTLAELMVATSWQIPPHPDAYWNIYFEVPLGENWRDAVHAARKAIKFIARSHYKQILAINPDFHYLHRTQSFSGLKFRCGGIEPAAFPTPEQLAFAISTAYLDMLRLKFTAGLHHPIRHFNAGVGTHMHGFLNVLGAAALSRRQGLSEEQIGDILRDERAENFVFTDEEFRWKEISVPTDKLTAMGGSFGSCSFDEPRDDLRALGLL